MLLSAILAVGFSTATLQDWLTQAFYPVLLGILVIASLGLPIPEDVPLIAAGVVLHTHPGVASWPGTLLVALAGIMTGDLILFTLGRRWGQDVINHRMVRWILTPARFAVMKERFHHHGTWMCFFGRFFMGIRGAMCLTAGATHFPFWRFYLADFAGALLSVPFFVWLGYWFAGMLPTLRKYLAGFQWTALALAILGIGLFVWYEIRRHRRARAREEALAARLAGEHSADRQPHDDPRHSAARPTSAAPTPAAPVTVASAEPE